MSLYLFVHPRMYPWSVYLDSPRRSQSTSSTSPLTPTPKPHCPALFSSSRVQERLRRLAPHLDWLAFSVDASTDKLHALVRTYLPNKPVSNRFRPATLFPLILFCIYLKWAAASALTSGCPS